ncbi:HEPN domain-containing protein [Candidatus Woesearchaeota archaeon]|nr:HEPN domain-containing protein [Candidatus Woesearchaeota archaeon]
MNEYQLKKYLEEAQLVDRKIKNYIDKGVLKKQEVDEFEIKGHVEKAEHNLRFVSGNIKLNFYDWALTGCYYACYHAALGLILKKGYSSKNHNATLLVLIKEYYKNGLDKEDIETLSEFLNYQDLLFYVESKNKRENATYSTKTKFKENDVIQMKMKASLFVSKVKDMF